MMEGYAALLRAADVNVKTLDAADEDHFSVLAKLGGPEFGGPPARACDHAVRPRGPASPSAVW